MRLIDADRLLEVLKANYAIYRSKIRGSYLDGVHDGINTTIIQVVSATTIEARKHGHWIRADKRFWKCSECNYEKHIRRISEAGMYKTPYCPYCGAVMDEVK